MIQISKKIERIFRNLYELEQEQRGNRTCFEKIMESNESRLNYLNHLFNVIKRNEVNEYYYYIFDDNIGFLAEFMNDMYKNELTVPTIYFKDKDDCLIVPEMDELEYLFKLFESNKEMYETVYKDKKFILDLPNKTFEQKMTRVLEIHEYNLAHLVGLTETEIEPNPNKNTLKKYFLSHVKDSEKYGDKDSEKLWNWVLSDEGKDELRRLNKITLDFIVQDKIQNPNNYDSNGVIKSISLPKFKERFKKETGLDFPLIKFSRYITKSINNLNFLNLDNTTHVILDYNAPYGRKDQKDIFIVNASPVTLFEDTKNYKDFLQNVLEVITHYANDDELKGVSLQLMEEVGVEAQDKDISSFINLIKTNKFFYGIAPNKEIALEKINNVLNEFFDRNVHLIGFDTNFNGSIIPLNKSIVNSTHCDTSISLSVVDLVSNYYKRGRAFFLDKLYSTSDNQMLRLSNPCEEILYLKQMELLEPEHLKKREKLEKKLAIFNKNYDSFNNSFGKNRRR